MGVARLIRYAAPLILLAGPAYASPPKRATARQMISSCATEGADYCDGYIEALWDETAAEFSRQAKGPPPIMARGQLSRRTIAYINEHPTLLDVPASRAALAAHLHFSQELVDGQK